MDKEAVGIRKYVLYVEQRMRYVKLLANGMECNEYRYYLAMHRGIKNWGKTHAVFYSHLIGNCSTEEGKRILGVPERTFFRLMRKQRKELVSFIKKQEDVLQREYPFIPVSDVFESLVMEGDDV